MSKTKISLLPEMGNVRVKVRESLLVPFAAIVLPVMALGGCSAFSIGSSEYGCSGMPDGIQCMSARDVYAATSNGNVPAPMRRNNQDLSGHSNSNEGIDHAADALPPDNTTGSNLVNTFVAPRLNDRPIPIRTPAQVMRIWVAPWEDLNGDLITNGYVYTEIEARKWVIAEPAEKVEGVFKPLQAKIRGNTTSQGVKNPLAGTPDAKGSEGPKNLDGVKEIANGVN